MCVKNLKCVSLPVLETIRVAKNGESDYAPAHITIVATYTTRMVQLPATAAIEYVAAWNENDNENENEN